MKNILEIKLFKPMIRIFIKLVKLFAISLLIISFSTEVFSQGKYWIFFKDKSGVEFNPYSYFDIKAIERREKSAIPLYDSTDFPLNRNYVRTIEEISGNIEAELRWFNAVVSNLTIDQLHKIKQLPFIQRVEVILPMDFVSTADYDTLLKADDLRVLETQTSRMQGELFQAKGFTGKGIRIAVFDAGFPNVDKLPIFSHLIKNKQIKATWDFAKKKEDVYLSNPHGTMVLSCIAGITNGKAMGLAPDAEFLLARTEVEREVYMEEVYWLQAVEWADKNGADIINSSLAYTYERYYTFEMNGHTSLVAKAANMAANKGMLVINAMGNDGNSDWKILATPADADSVMSVGAINPITDFHAGFSSFGPTSEFKMKPNVVAPGKVIAAGKLKLEKTQGTSFAAPLVAGFAACAWQSMRFLTNMQLFEKIEQSGHLFPYFDYAHGYGVPQASCFTETVKQQNNNSTFEFKLQNDTIFIEIDPKFIDKKYLKNTNYLYYHIENKNGYLENYWLIDVFTKRAAYICIKEFPDGKTLRAHFKQFTNEFHFN